MLKLPKLHSLALALAMLGGTAMAADEAKKPAEVDGLLTVQSAHSAAESVKRIEEALKAKGLTIFTVIDHQQAAKDHQLDMPAASVIVFGNPKLGTPMMQQAPTLAIDLPSKVLVWEDGKGHVFVSMNTASYMGQRHHLSADVTAPLAGLEKLVPAAVQ